MYLYTRLTLPVLVKIFCAFLFQLLRFQHCCFFQFFVCYLENISLESKSLFSFLFFKTTTQCYFFCGPLHLDAVRTPQHPYEARILWKQTTSTGKSFSDEETLFDVNKGTQTIKGRVRELFRKFIRFGDTFLTSVPKRYIQKLFLFHIGLELFSPFCEFLPVECRMGR